MLYALLNDSLDSPFLRAALAAVISGLTVLLVVPALARLALRRRFVDRKDKSGGRRLNELHEQKRGTPYVGGCS